MTTLPKDRLNNFIQSLISKNVSQHTEEPFYVLHLGVVANLMDKWVQSLPEVRPFYAVKCNSDPSLPAAMAAIGSGFDCGSRAEIESVLALGVSPDRIVFANTCKMEFHIKYAATVGVNLTTFDSVAEVEKIRKLHPKCSLLMRIKSPEDGRAPRRASDSKFGALPEEVSPLLHAAQLSMVGVSFHVGTAVKNFKAYDMCWFYRSNQKQNNHQKTRSPLWKLRQPKNKFVDLCSSSVACLLKKSGSAPFFASR